jgi:hypothetical protein
VRHHFRATPRSDTCTWDELALLGNTPSPSEVLSLPDDWTRRWTATWRYSGNEIVSAVRDLGAMPRAGCEPVRRFSWSRNQKHRPGLQYMVSTGRHHGFESLEEARLLLALDFAGGVKDVLGQPFKLRYTTADRTLEHVPDFITYTSTGVWLIDVRPAKLIKPKDWAAFTATSEVALALGWRYAAVTGWQPHIITNLDALAAQRRRLEDPLGMAERILACITDGPRPFGEIVNSTSAAPIARAHLLNLLWSRRVGISMVDPLSDAAMVYGSHETTW